MRQAENIITDWLEKHRDPEIDKFVEKNIAITEKIRIALEEKKWTFKDLANAMDKSPSEVSKWLTGLHNVTLKSIIKLEMALGIELINTEKPEKEYVHWMIRTNITKEPLNDYKQVVAV